MTRTTNARIAGSMFLVYIAAGVSNMILFGRAASGEGPAARLASIAQHETTMRVAALLTLATFPIAVALAVSLYALTRDEDRDLAAMALCFRAGEGVIAAVSAIRTLGLVSLAVASTAAAGPDAAAAIALGAMLLKQGGATALVAATAFAIASTLYSWLFLRARSIPVPLAWLGVVASVLLVAALPVQVAGFLRGPATWLVWMPMLVYELALAVWLIVKGVAAPAAR